MKITKTLKNGKQLEANFTRAGYEDCCEHFVNLEVAVDIFSYPEVSEYFSDKNEGDNFMVVDTLMNMAVFGYITYADDEEYEILITKCTTDLCVVERTDGSLVI